MVRGTEKALHDDFAAWLAKGDPLNPEAVSVQIFA